MGFLSFWITSATDSVALGITTLLCSLALRETVTFPDVAYLTWMEVFVNFRALSFSFIIAIFWSRSS